jgi:single-strand DNA-binding protein
MANAFRGRGNLGADPELKHVEVDDAPRTVLDLRVYFDRPVPTGGDEFEDKGGFWLNVALWGPRAGRLEPLLQKGMRVYVEGTLVSQTWEDADSGEARSALVLTADYLAIDTSRIKAIVMAAPKPPGAA